MSLGAVSQPRPRLGCPGSRRPSPEPGREADALFAAPIAAGGLGAARTEGGAVRSGGQRAGFPHRLERVVAECRQCHDQQGRQPVAAWYRGRHEVMLSANWKCLSPSPGVVCEKFRFGCFRRYSAKTGSSSWSCEVAGHRRQSGKNRLHSLSGRLPSMLIAGDQLEIPLPPIEGKKACKACRPRAMPPSAAVAHIGVDAVSRGVADVPSAGIRELLVARSWAGSSRRPQARQSLRWEQSGRQKTNSRGDGRTHCRGVHGLDQRLRIV